jgi:ribonuclease PH
MLHGIAAISVGLFGGEARLDLPYVEDAQADVDFNFVMTENGRFIEVQGTAEHGSFSVDEYAALMGLATAGTRDLVACQRAALERAKP